MSRQLHISNKIFSLRDRMLVSDSSSNVVYEAAGDFTLFRSTWRVYKRGTQVAVIKHKIFSLSSTWLISGSLGEFKIRRKILSFTRSYKVIGGVFDGALISGSLLGFTFEIIRNQKTIASAHEKILSLRDSYSIDILSENPDDELLTIISLVALRLDKANEQKAETREHQDQSR
jgi:uncharacterized protein YxjI